jgi:DDE superfamily endonuclease
VRTWSPRGETPVLQLQLGHPLGRSGDHVLQLLLLAVPGQREKRQVPVPPQEVQRVVDFLLALLRQIPGRLLIIWDRLSAHRSQVTRDFIAEQGERLWVEYLPGYAPELNPVEYIWAYWKQHALPNVCPKDTGGWTRLHVER